VVKADKDYYMVLVPANRNLDLDKVKKNISKLKQKDVKVLKIPGEKDNAKCFKFKRRNCKRFWSIA